jgi:hypothetical protein
MTNSCHPKRTLLAGGELVCAVMGGEHQIVHLVLPTIHKPLVIALERMVVPCISVSHLLS